MPKKKSNSALTDNKSQDGPTPALAADERDHSVAELAIASDGKNPAAVALGRLGGLKGGKARAAKLSKRQRSAIAKKAAQARWGKSNPSP